jgi:hypothetical protein
VHKVLPDRSRRTGQRCSENDNIPVVGQRDGGKPAERRPGGRYSAIAGREPVPVARTTAGSAAIVTHSVPSLRQHDSAFQGWARYVPHLRLSAITYIIDTVDVTNSPCAGTGQQ